jgi:hypothetical protein
MSFLLSLMFSLQQNWRTREWNRIYSEAETGGEMWPKQCTHMGVTVKTIKKKFPK